MLKKYEITYFDTKRTRTVVANSLTEKYEIIKECEDKGYSIENVREYDPVPVEERFYA